MQDGDIGNGGNTTYKRAASRIGELSNTEAIPIFDPGDNRAYFLVPAEIYEKLRSGENNLVEHFYPLMDEVASREGWDDPEMDAYDKLDPRTQP